MRMADAIVADEGSERKRPILRVRAGPAFSCVDLLVPRRGRPEMAEGGRGGIAGWRRGAGPPAAGGLAHRWVSLKAGGWMGGIRTGIGWASIGPGTTKRARRRRTLFERSLKSKRRSVPFRPGPPPGRLALAGLEAALGLVDDVNSALTAHNAAIAMAVLERAERIPDFHRPSPHIAAPSAPLGVCSPRT